RTTTYTGPEEWLMTNVIPPLHSWVQTHAYPLDLLLRGLSALGSGWFVALGFALTGLLALAKGRRDLAVLLALGTLAFPIEWLLNLGAHYPMDLLGGWMAGAALLSILVCVHVLTVDERVRREALAARQVAAASGRGRVAVPLHDRKSGARAT